MIQEKEFIIVSVKRTKRVHAAITLVRPGNSGFCWETASAGRYSETSVLSKLSFYSNGTHSIAVPAEVVEELTREVLYDYDATAMCVPNTQGVWSKLLENAIRSTPSLAKPEYRSAYYPLSGEDADQVPA